MFKILLAVLVAGVIAAMVAHATEPVGPLPSPEVNRIAKGDRLEVHSRAKDSTHQGTHWSPQQRLPTPIVLPPRRADVRIASL